MDVWHTFPEPPLPAAWVTVGGFDGVHRGHQRLIAQVVDHARKAGGRAVVVTFDPLPAVFFGRRPARYLTPTPEKLALFAQLGVDATVVLPFDHDLAHMPPEDFVARLRQHLGMQGLVCGPDFALGHDRRGDVAFLRQLAAREGFTLHVLEEVRNGEARISASRVRQALDQGDVALAARLLGRPYVLQARVLPGAGRGRKVGFSTANLEPPAEKWLPAEGVYAGWARWEGAAAWHPAVANLGRRPTFGPLPKPLLEVHLLDYTGGPLYGRPMAFAFLQRLRGERKFPSPQALRAQIARDVAQARDLLARSEPPRNVPLGF